MVNYGKMTAMMIGVLLLLTGCADREATIPVDEEVVVEEDVYKDSDRVYRRLHRTVFEDIEPMITEEVSQEDFWAIYSEADSLGEAVPCIYRTEVRDDRSENIALFHVEDGLKFEKICTYEECRADEGLYCEHLSPPLSYENSAIWYGDCMYYIADYAVPGTKDLYNYMILRWQEGSDHFEKIFEAERFIKDIHVTNGLMYLNAADNLGSGMYSYYILNLDYQVYTEVETAHSDALYLFGEKYIVMYDQEGAHLVSTMLKTGTDVCDSVFPGQISGNYYWYTEYEKQWEFTLYRADLRYPGEKVKVMDAIRAFAVCADMLFYEPSVSSDYQVVFEYRNEDGDGLSGFTNNPDRKIMRARIFNNGTFGTPETAVKTGQKEWIKSWDDYRVIGENFLYVTVTPGNEQDVKWYEHTHIADWQKTREFSVSAER